MKTTITIQFEANTDVNKVNNALTYKLSWKQYPQPWSDAQTKLIHIPTNNNSNNNSKIKAEVADLLPSTTYCLRLIMVENGNEFGQHSPELIVDTEAIGCTPGQKSSSCCCTIQ